MRTTTLIMNNLAPSLPALINGNHMRDTKDLVLSNSLAADLNAVKMKLDIARFSLFNTNGEEVAVEAFEGQRGVRLEGEYTQKFIRTRRQLDIPAGKYDRIRFYLASNGGQLFQDDGASKDLGGFEYLDFQIEGEMPVLEGESPDLILRFNFNRFRNDSLFRPFKQLFGRSRNSGVRLLSKLSHT